MVQLFEGFHIVKLILLVGGELAPHRHRHHLPHRLLSFALDGKLLAMNRLFVPHGASGPGLQPTELTLWGGTSHPNPDRVM